MLLKKSFVIHLCCLKKYSDREINNFPNRYTVNPNLHTAEISKELIRKKQIVVGDFFKFIDKIHIHTFVETLMFYQYKII